MSSLFKNRVLFLLGVLIIFLYLIAAFTLLEIPFSLGAWGTYLTFIVTAVFFVYVLFGHSLHGLDGVNMTLILWLIVYFLNFVLRGDDFHYWIDQSMWCMFFFLVFWLVKGLDDVKWIIMVGIVCVFVSLFAAIIKINIQGATITSVEEAESNMESIVSYAVTALPLIMIIERSWLRWSIISLVFIMTILSARRIALICTLITVFFTFLMYLRDNKEKDSIIKVLILLVGVFIIVQGPFSEALDNAFNRMRAIREDQGSGRIELWREVINIQKQSGIGQWIFGHGFYGVREYTSHTASHNDFLEMLFDYGILGLTLLAALFLKLFKKSKCLFRAKSFFAYPFIASVFIFLLYGMLGNCILYTTSILLLVVFWATVFKCTYEEG